MSQFIRPVRKALTVVRDHNRLAIGICRLCHTKFYEGEMRAYEQHVVRCGHTHEESIHAMSPRTRLPMLSGGDDVELERWVRDNAEKIIERRKRI